MGRNAGGVKSTQRSKTKEVKRLSKLITDLKGKLEDSQASFNYFVDQFMHGENGKRTKAMANKYATRMLSTRNIVNPMTYKLQINKIQNFIATLN